MLKILLIRTGATEYESQGRVQGTLDIPLSEDGRLQVEQVVQALRDEKDLKIDSCFAGPCKATQQTAEILSAAFKLKVKTIDELRNLNYGFWQGLLIDDIKAKQPKIYRQWLEHPETVCPPEGESLQVARERLNWSMAKIAKKQKQGIAAVIVAEPLTSLLRNALRDDDLGNLWDSHGDPDTAWELIDVPTQTASKTS